MVPPLELSQGRDDDEAYEAVLSTDWHPFYDTRGVKFYHNFVTGDVCAMHGHGENEHGGDSRFAQIDSHVAIPRSVCVQQLAEVGQCSVENDEVGSESGCRRAFRFRVSSAPTPADKTANGARKVGGLFGPLRRLSGASVGHLWGIFGASLVAGRAARKRNARATHAQRARPNLRACVALALRLRMGFFGATLGVFGASVGPLWVLWGLFRLFGAFVGPLWGFFGASLGPLWGLCDVVGPLWGLLGPLWGPLGASTLLSSRSELASFAPVDFQQVWKRTLLAIACCHKPGCELRKYWG